MNASPVEEKKQNSLTSDRYADFLEALDVLYIKNNISGRNQFTAAWPGAAIHIFGEELMQFDREGAADRERRIILETEADDRRIALLEIAETVEKKSVFEGALQIEYVQNLVNQLGRPLALHIYSRKVVDRFIPPSPDEVIPEPVAEEVAPPPPLPVEEKIYAPYSDDRMDKIRPISVEQDLGPEPEPEMEPEEDKPLFAAGAFDSRDEAPMPKPAPEQELIIETQGAEAIAVPTGEQESLAPVVGAKKSGLKILSISDGEADPDKNQ